MTERTVIHVGENPDLHLGFGDYFDGDTAVRQSVEVTVDDDMRALILTPEGGDPLRWPYDDIRLVRDQAGGDLMTLRLAAPETDGMQWRGEPTQRLILRNSDDMMILRSRAKQLNKRVKARGVRKLFGLSIAAVASVALIILVLVPFLADRLATFLPPEGEKALGDSTLAQIRSALDETGFQPLPLCVSPDGVAALDVMRTTLLAGNEGAPELTVTVLDHPMVNAFALPGGHVVFFRGLIDEARRPEEVAAVFAHEIGHVVARDPTRIALRSAGSIGVLGLLFGDFAGGAIVLFMTERMIQANYTQEAEAGADTFAYGALLEADVAPSALATFFERLIADQPEENSIVQHFLSHPEMGDRIAAARIATPSPFSGTPILTDAQWLALQNICN
jgi:Zn-dependent protease with chaperone function